MNSELFSRKILILILALHGTFIFGQIPKELIETRKLIDRNEYLKAIAKLNAFISKDSSSDEAYTQRGQCLRKVGNYEATFKDLNHAIRLNNSNAEAYCVLGSTFAMTGKYDSSLFCFNISIKINPDYAPSYSSRGALYSYFLNSDGKALEDYNRAINLDSKMFNAYYNRALIFRKKTLFIEAIADLDQALKLHPKDHLVYYEQGACFQDMKEYKKAIRSYKKAIQYNSKTDPFEELQYNNLYQYLGECYRALEKNKEAEKYFKRAK